MAEETAPSSSNAPKKSLDLNTLSGLDFGPDWADEKSKKSPNLKRFEDRGGKKGRGKPSATRDRRSGGRPPRTGDDRQRNDGGHERRGGGQQQARPIFEPTVKVDLYPQDEAFEALVNRLRTSARTYQLFEIAHLLLEKPERYVVVVAPQQKKQVSDGVNPLLYYSVPDHLPFESEEQAIDYVLNEHVDLFFDFEEIEVDPPSGNFQMINRCSITGALLGPPNYHLYQDFVQRHYSAKITGMSLDRFRTKIESTKEQEDIDAWLDSMRKGARFTVKDRRESEPESFDTLVAARHFLIAHRKDQVVGSGEHIRFAGRDIERMPKGNIRKSVESYVEQQKHFPLDSANNIRGRLRRHKFAVYKKGSKGVSFVCAVKRKFRDGKNIFTDSIRDLIEFIEKHPDIPASKLSKEYIGVDTEKQKPAVLEMKEAPEDTATAVTPEAGAVAEAEVSAKAEEQPAKDAVPSVAKEASTEAKPKSDLSKDEEKKLNQLMLDLRWLITEGYVTEYGDGRLFAPAPLPESNKTSKEPAKVDSEKNLSKEVEETTKAPPETTGESTEKTGVSDMTPANSEDAESPETTPTPPEPEETVEEKTPEGKTPECL